MLIAGDAAAMTLAAGLWLEGVNFAIGAGYEAGRAAAAAVRRADTSAAGLASYRRALEGSFVLQDHRRLRRAPHLILSERIQRNYTGMVCDAAEQVFNVDNPRPKPGLARIVVRSARRNGVRVRDLLRDGAEATRTFR
jgi:electron transfer flavoprotein-quinone oxidoreductase